MRFRILFISKSYFYLVWCGASELTFVTWPNETQVVVNETVKFIWKYRAIDTDVTVKWGTSEFISPNVATFKDIFFIAREYEKYRKPIMHDKIPLRYRDRVQIVGQASLQIINVTLEDEGHYLCEITEGSGWKTLSRAATLRVLGECTRVSKNVKEFEFFDRVLAHAQIACVTFL